MLAHLVQALQFAVPKVLWQVPVDCRVVLVQTPRKEALTAKRTGAG